MSENNVKTQEGAEGTDGAKNNETTYTEAEVSAKIESAIKARFSKFADYDQLKEQAAKADELQSTIEELEQSKADLEKQLNEFKTDKEHSDLIAKVAKKTGRTAEEIALLQGDSEEALTAAAESIWKKYEPSKEGSPLDEVALSNGWSELAHNLFS